MMIYPRQRHGFTDPRLNKHLRQLMFDFIMRTVGDGDAVRPRRARPGKHAVSFLDSLQSGNTVIAAELRPPRAELGSAEGMDAWIDTYHAVRALTRQDVAVFLTDSAVGTQEENNLRHLVTNLGRDAAARPRRPVPDDQAFARFLSELCRAGVAARVPCAGRPRRRSDARPAALRRACVAAAPRDPAARAAASARGLGESVRRCRAAGGFPDARQPQRRFLPHAGRQPSRHGARSRDSSRKRAAADSTICRGCLGSFITAARTRGRSSS